MRTIKLTVLTLMLAFAGVAYASTDDVNTVACCAKAGSAAEAKACCGKDAGSCCSGESCEKSSDKSSVKSGSGAAAKAEKKEGCCAGGCCDKVGDAGNKECGKECCKGKDGKCCAMKSK